MYLFEYELLIQPEDNPSVDRVSEAAPLQMYISSKKKKGQKTLEHTSCKETRNSAEFSLFISGTMTRLYLRNIKKKKSSLSM